MNISALNLQPGDKIGKYEILRLEGRGGMGAVYLAEQKLIKRKVAIKLITTKDERLLAQVRRASEILASIDHPNIVGLHDVDEHEGYFYEVTKYIEGKALSNLIESGDELTATVALKLTISIADALDYVHSLGIIHGDIKPSNIMVSSGGNPVLVDLGVMGSTEDDAFSGMVLGTPAYLSPEAWRGERDTRSDLWALGITLHYLLTGRIPFEVTDPQEMGKLVTSETPLDLSDLRRSAPKPVLRIVERCLEKELDKRYQSAAELRRDLESALVYLESGEFETAATVARPLQAGSTILLNVEYKEPGIPGQYREYHIKDKVGEGAFSVVYRATDIIGKREVALKVLRRERSQSENVLIRFQREASLLSRLNHPNIVRVYNFGRYAADFFIVMEMLGGLTVQDALESDYKFDIQQAAVIAAQVLSGVDRIHAQGNVHRDIKPGNIMLQPERTVVMDFGVARISGETQLTVDGEIFGTPLYMAPEQVRGETATYLSDLYAIGVILYELLTQRTPHEADSTASLIFSIATEKPEPITKYRSDLPPALLSFLERVLALEPAHRPRSTQSTRESLLESVGLREDQVAAIQHQMFRQVQQTLVAHRLAH
jgi:serine/threonine protein kinase